MVVPFHTLDAEFPEQATVCYNKLELLNELDPSNTPVSYNVENKADTNGVI